MTRVRLLLAVLATLAACELFQPNLDQYGYTTCGSDDDCADTGRLCETGYCTPPPWWDKRFKHRRELVVVNGSASTLPKGFPVTLPVGPAGKLPVDEVNTFARVVALDRTLRTQVELMTTTDNVVSNGYDLIFTLPADLPPSSRLPGIWVYSSAESGTEARPNGKEAIYVIDEGFRDDELDSALWRTDGNPVFVPNDLEVKLQRGDFLWSDVSLPGVPGVELEADFTLTPVETCNGLTVGLIANDDRGFQSPYAVVSATGNGKLSVDVQEGAEFPAQVGEVIASNVTQKLLLRVRGDLVTATLNGEELDPLTLEDPITAPLHAHFFVEGGTCTLTVKKVRMRAAVEPEPVVEPGARVQLPPE
ncbi:MAG: hypothetical protein AB2A00_42180 [Myxococcota bacterium]